MFILKVLLGQTFTKFEVLALGVGLFFSVGVASRDVVFSRTGVGSIIVYEL